MSRASRARGPSILGCALLAAGVLWHAAARGVAGPIQGVAPFASPWVGEHEPDRVQALGPLGPIARALIERQAGAALVVGDFGSETIRDLFPPLAMATWPMRYAPMDARFLPSVEEVRALLAGATEERPIYVVVLGDAERVAGERAAAFGVFELVVKTESAMLLRGGPR